MNIRVQQIWGFLQTVLGWIFIACSLAMEGWKVAATGGQGGSAVVTVAWHWASLWRSCSTEANAISNCYDFPVLWAVERHVQIVRALLMTGMAIGVLGFILSMVGMECTYIGGKVKEKNRSIFIGGLCHSSSGLLAATGYAVYAWHVSSEYFNPGYDLQYGTSTAVLVFFSFFNLLESEAFQMLTCLDILENYNSNYFLYDLGAPLFLGWAGCLFQISGGLFYLVSIQKVWTEENDSSQGLVVSAEEGKYLRSSPTELSIISDLSSRSKVSALSELSLLSSSPSKISRKTQHPPSV